QLDHGGGLVAGPADPRGTPPRRTRSHLPQYARALHRRPERRGDHAMTGTEVVELDPDQLALDSDELGRGGILGDSQMPSPRQLFAMLVVGIALAAPTDRDRDTHRSSVRCSC